MKIQKKQKRQYDVVNYWESMADSMVGLLLCVLLIVMLLVLYLVQVPEEDFVDKEMGNSYELYDDADAGGGNHSYGATADDPGNAWQEDVADEGGAGGAGGSGGAGGGGGADDASYRYEDPEPGAGSGDGTDKAAVLVQLVDSETGRTIKKKGVEFELYGTDRSLKVLSTYYPKKIDYSKYETDEKGVFYLPERIPLLTYSLHELTGIVGYDVTENTEFTLDQAFDWDNPYVVSVNANPSKNIIRMELKDTDNGSAVTGATFQVVAATNIITQDGTTRYKEGEVADVITLDENGYGESKELYLGDYLLRQEMVPQYYGKITADQEVKVESKTDVKVPAATVVAEDKTSIVVELKDALYDTIYIEGAEFTLLLDDGTVVQKMMTDTKGRIEISDLKKNTTYHLQQTGSISSYQVDPGDYSFTVNEDGLIDGATEKKIDIKNRIIRVSIGVKDKLFRGQLSDINVALYDASDNVVETWNTTGLEKTIEGLKPGEYRVVISGNEDNAEIITVEDKTDLQVFQFDRWTAADIGTILAFGLILIALIVLLRWLLKIRREKKREEKEDEAVNGGE